MSPVDKLHFHTFVLRIYLICYFSVFYPLRFKQLLGVHIISELPISFIYLFVLHYQPVWVLLINVLSSNACWVISPIPSQRFIRLRLIQIRHCTHVLKVIFAFREPWRIFRNLLEPSVRVCRTKSGDRSKFMVIVHTRTFSKRKMVSHLRTHASSVTLKTFFHVILYSCKETDFNSAWITGSHMVLNGSLLCSYISFFRPAVLIISMIWQLPCVSLILSIKNSLFFLIL